MVSRTSLILYVILAVVVVGGGAYFAINRDRVTKLVNPNANTVTNQPVVRNQADINALPNSNAAVPELKGTNEFSGSLQVGEVSLALSSWQRSSTYAGYEASAGNSLLVIFIDAVPAAQVSQVFDAVATDVRIEYTGGTAVPKRVKIASTEFQNDRGYLVFELPTAARNQVLINGAGPAAGRLTLPSS